MSKVGGNYLLNTFYNKLLDKTNVVQGRCIPGMQELSIECSCIARNVFSVLMSFTVFITMCKVTNIIHPKRENWGSTSYGAV